MTKSIISFSDDYRFLSNFYPATIVDNGINYPTSEHAYQATKMMNKRDSLFIAEQSTPGRAKRLGQLLPIRPDWEEVKIPIMNGILRMKFSHPELRKMLLETGDAYLEEGNRWGDQFWGVCDGIGENKLGNILMIIREEIREEIRND